eukprot:1243147-Rhodomonas_salina.1
MAGDDFTRNSMPWHAEEYTVSVASCDFPHCPAATKSEIVSKSVPGPWMIWILLSATSSRENLKRSSQSCDALIISKGEEKPTTTYGSPVSPKPWKGGRLRPTRGANAAPSCDNDRMYRGYRTRDDHKQNVENERWECTGMEGGEGYYDGENSVCVCFRNGVTSEHTCAIRCVPDIRRR